MNRKVFGPYNDGAKDVYADPLRVHRLLVNELKGQHREVLAASRSQSNEIAFPAIERLIAAVRVAFDMTPWDVATGTGATEDDCFNVLDQFLEWQDKKKESAETSPTSRPSSDGDSSATATTSSQATNSPSASG